MAGVSSVEEVRVDGGVEHNPFAPVMEKFISACFPGVHQAMFDKVGVERDEVFGWVNVAEEYRKNSAYWDALLDPLLDIMEEQPEASSYEESAPGLSGFYGNAFRLGDGGVEFASGPGATESKKYNMCYEPYHYSGVPLDVFKGGENCTERLLNESLDGARPVCSRNAHSFLERDVNTEMVSVVPRCTEMAEAGLLVQNNDGTFSGKSFSSRGGCSFDERDCSKLGDFRLLYRLYAVLFFIRDNTIDFVKGAVDHLPDLPTFRSMTSPGSQADASICAIFSRKVDGEIVSLYGKNGEAKMMIRKQNAVVETYQTTSTHCVPFWFLFERIGDVLIPICVWYNSLKIPQTEDAIGCFFKKVKLNIPGFEICTDRDGFPTDGLVGYVPGRWDSCYFKKKRDKTLDLDFKGIAAVVDADWTYPRALREPCMLGGNVCTYRAVEEFHSVKVFDKEAGVDVDRELGGKCYYLDHVCCRHDKERSDPVARCLLILDQPTEEDIVEANGMNSGRTIFGLLKKK